MKRFNTTGCCYPSDHYMVDISERLKIIKAMVDAGDYFCINRSRQYGKTTTLNALQIVLSKEYYVIIQSFQSFGEDTFQSADSFCRDFASDFCKRFHSAANKNNPDLTIVIDEVYEHINESQKQVRMFNLFQGLQLILEAADKPVVLIIDEVDSATNNQVFLDFLAQLRNGYLSRKTISAFHSVILAGVTDVKHLKAKIRPNEAHKENSPWNIASDFNIDMSLSEAGIKGMLDDYEADHHTGMETGMIAKLLRDYTSGYPYLVSRLCQLIDGPVSEKMRSSGYVAAADTSCSLDTESGSGTDPDLSAARESESASALSAAWTERGVEEAVKLILSENNTLFQSLTKNLNLYPEMKAALRSMLMEGAKISYIAQQEDIELLKMYGLIRNDGNTVRVSNRIFETMLYNIFISEEEMKNNVFSREGDYAKNRFVSEDGKLNMRLILEGFIHTYTQVFGPLEDRFKEKDGRELFLLYLKPIINGTGNYYIEAQTRDQTRTDVIVDYLGQQYIVELKIWRGPRYNEEGEKQIRDYLDYFGLTTGYMLSFNFNKNKETGVKRVAIGDKILYEATV